MPIYEFSGKKPVIASDAFIHPEAVIIGNARIGSNCFIGPGAVIRADFGPISVGNRSLVQDNAVIHVSPNDEVIIEECVIIAHGVLLHDVHIRRQCLIGMGAVLLQKVVCDEQVMVAAGSVVPTGMHIPTRKMVAGNPARIVKDVPEDFEARVEWGLGEYRRITEEFRNSLKIIGDRDRQ
jgi:carbonic anhydrase/acetyltransferase-like protein (isoleucine patch superfamily)